MARAARSTWWLSGWERARVLVRGRVHVLLWLSVLPHSELLMLVQARTRSWAGEQTVVVALQPQVRAMKLPQRGHRPCLPAAELSC